MAFGNWGHFVLCTIEPKSHRRYILDVLRRYLENLRNCDSPLCCPIKKRKGKGLGFSGIRHSAQGLAALTSWLVLPVLGLVSQGN